MCNTLFVSSFFTVSPSSILCQAPPLRPSNPLINHRANDEQTSVGLLGNNFLKQLGLVNWSTESYPRVTCHKYSYVGRLSRRSPQGGSGATSAPPPALPHLLLRLTAAEAAAGKAARPQGRRRWGFVHHTLVAAGGASGGGGGGGSFPVQILAGSSPIWRGAGRWRLAAGESSTLGLETARTGGRQGRRRGGWAMGLAVGSGGSRRGRGVRLRGAMAVALRRQRLRRRAVDVGVLCVGDVKTLAKALLCLWPIRRQRRPWAPFPFLKCISQEGIVASQTCECQQNHKTLNRSSGVKLLPCSTHDSTPSHICTYVHVDES
uniref:Uncharacterized protein n=1 Tax=Oryza punctata TaxID=4537 RepID=A0A0E0M9Y0_ORYPU